MRSFAGLPAQIFRLLEGSWRVRGAAARVWLGSRLGRALRPSPTAFAGNYPDGSCGDGLPGGFFFFPWQCLGLIL